MLISSSYLVEDNGTLLWDLSSIGYLISFMGHTTLVSFVAFLHEELILSRLMAFTSIMFVNYYYLI